MIRYRQVLTLILVLFSVFVRGQNSENKITVRRCGHNEYVQLLIKEDPGFLERRQQIEKDMAEWLKNNPYEDLSAGKIVYTIPVVVHVLYNDQSHNIPHTRIVEQIESLNKDFRKLNPDVSNVPAAFASRVADVEFQFCLAQRDPQGKWTNGVTRRQVSKTSFSYNDDNIIKSTSLGGQSNWDPSKYLNIWVVNLTGGVLGYTQPPGGQASKDGVVVGYKYFGLTGALVPFNRGRTATHEIGHWFNLIHIWGDDEGACWGSDYVSDTPNQASEFYGCPSFPKMDACTPDSPGVLFMNFMDYVDDACMCLFTNGQKARMISALNIYRSELKTSNGCEPATGIENVPDISDFTLWPNPGNGNFNIELMMHIMCDVRIMVYNPLGQQVWSTEYSNVSFLREPVDLTSLDPGAYVLQIVAGAHRLNQRIIIQR